jgi:hypothetical protein
MVQAASSRCGGTGHNSRSCPLRQIVEGHGLPAQPNYEPAVNHNQQAPAHPRRRAATNAIAVIAAAAANINLATLDANAAIKAQMKSRQSEEEAAEERRRAAECQARRRARQNEEEAAETTVKLNKSAFLIPQPRINNLSLF